MLQPQALASLKLEYDKAYEEITEKTKTLEAYKGDYQNLKARLKTLPDKIEHEALVPLGTKALGFGKIIHTNEIMCLLGDNWFMECSAKTATEIVDRRIKRCNKSLEEQKQEAERLENWKSSLTKLILDSASNDTLDIVEEVSDEDYERLGREHRENVKRYHQEQAQAREQKTSQDDKEEMEKFWQRLDELELEEEMMQAEEQYENRKREREKVSLSSSPSTSKSSSVLSASSSKTATVPGPSTFTASVPEPTTSTAFSDARPSTSKASILSTSKTALNTSQKKPTKSVTFNEEDEIRIIPEITKQDDTMFSDNMEELPTPIVIKESVQGLNSDIIERPSVADILAVESEIRPPVKNQTAFDPKAVAVPIKKPSLFKQRRQQ